MGLRTARLGLISFGFVIASSGCGATSGDNGGASTGGMSGRVGVAGDSALEAETGGVAGGPSGSGGGGGTVAAAGSSNEGMGGQRAGALGGGSGRGGAAAAGAGGGDAGGDGAQASGGSCALARRVEVPFSVRTSPPAIVVRSGSEFGLLAGSTLEALSWSGELAQQVFEQQACANSTCDGLFGRTALRGEAGWRLLSADRVGQKPSIRAWRMGDASLPEAQPLCGPEFSGRVSAFDLRPSRDGKRALFANGHRVVTTEVQFALLDAEGQLVTPAQTLELPYNLWNSLTVVPTEQAGALSVLAESEDHAQRLWLLGEVDSLGRLVFTGRVELPPDYSCAPGGAGDCAIVEDADAYYIWLASNDRPLRIARLSRARPNELIIDENVVAPGALVGALSKTLVFRQDEYLASTVQTRFLGLPKEGAAEPQTLFVAPAVARDLNVKAEVIGTEGDSIFYRYQTETSQIIEEVVCPATL